MQDISPAKQLDDVLEYITKTVKMLLVVDELLFEQFKDISTKEVIEIVGKLDSDKLIEIKEHTYEDRLYVSYYSTFKGRAFLEAGGYVAQNERDKRNIFNQLLNSRVITFGAALAGVYYLLEILRVYIVPFFQFVCACKFVWQK